MAAALLQVQKQPEAFAGEDRNPAGSDRRDVSESGRLLEGPGVEDRRQQQQSRDTQGVSQEGAARHGNPDDAAVVGGASPPPTEVGPPHGEAGGDVGPGTVEGRVGEGAQGTQQGDIVGAKVETLSILHF